MRATRLSHLSKDTSGARGAALILELIIYLVIVSLIAMVVVSSTRATRDLVFATHAKQDMQQVQSWVEGKYAQDREYPSTVPGNLSDPQVQMTKVQGNINTAKVASVNGSNAGYCILIQSASISDLGKRDFWLSSSNISKVMQRNTLTNPSGAATPPSGIPDLNCP